MKKAIYSLCLLPVLALQTMGVEVCGSYEVDTIDAGGVDINLERRQCLDSTNPRSYLSYIDRFDEFKKYYMHVLQNGDLEVRQSVFSGGWVNHKVLMARVPNIWSTNGPFYLCVDSQGRLILKDHECNTVHRYTNSWDNYNFLYLMDNGRLVLTDGDNEKWSTDDYYV